MFLFTPPMVYERIVDNHPLFGRMSLHRGVSLLKQDGLYRLLRHPGDEVIAVSDITYIGGHTYQVADSEAEDLRTAGYGDWLAGPYPDEGPIITPPPPDGEEPGGETPPPTTDPGEYGYGTYGAGEYGK